MQNPYGRVISVNDDASGKMAVVDVESVVACERCASGKGCGAGLFGSRPGDRQVQAAIAKGLDIRNGDVVSLMLEPRNVLRAAFIVYGLPLAGAVSAVTIAFTAGLDDVTAVFMALGGLFAGIWMAKFRLQRARCLRDFTPVVVDRLSAAGD